jgi:hypothetical protein
MLWLPCLNVFGLLQKKKKKIKSFVIQDKNSIKIEYKH